MSAIPAPQRIELSSPVRAILEADTPKSQLLRHFLRFTEAILAPDPAGIDRVVSQDARFHDTAPKRDQSEIRVLKLKWFDNEFYVAGFVSPCPRFTRFDCNSSTVIFKKSAIFSTCSGVARLMPLNILLTVLI
jgi:hypothetical protein